MSKKHVLILSFPHSSSMGGGERYTEQQVRGLMKHGFDFTLISSSKALLSIFASNGWAKHGVFGGSEPVTKLGVILFILTSPIFLLLHAGLLIWFKFVHKTEVVLCLSLTEKLLVTPMATALKMQVVWMEHLLPGKALLKNPYRKLLVKHAESADIVTVSEPAREALIEFGYPEERVHIISPGALVPLNAPAPNDAPVTGCVARLHKEKGVMTLIDAFSDVLREVPNAKLEIYGEGDEDALLKKTVTMRKLDASVTFHGWVDSRIGYYKNFRLLAVPSEQESFGMAALEAMSAGIPVVGTRVGGLSDLIKDKVTGLLVPPHDADALATALITLLSDPALCRTLGTAGHARAKNQFTDERFITEWNALLSN